MLETQIVRNTLVIFAKYGAFNLKFTKLKLNMQIRGSFVAMTLYKLGKETVLFPLFI